MKLIDKDALIAEIEERRDSLISLSESCPANTAAKSGFYAQAQTLEGIKKFINTLEVKEMDEQKERMNECPYRKVGCTMYEGNILECNGACSWVVDYPKLKELKAQKREEI